MDKETLEAVANSSWVRSIIVGVILSVVGMWNVLLIFVLRHLNARTNKVEDMAADKMQAISKELHMYLPRTECSILSGGIGEKVDELTGAVKTIHRRIDTFMHHTCEHCAKEVDKEIVDGNKQT